MCAMKTYRGTTDTVLTRCCLLGDSKEQARCWRQQVLLLERGEGGECFAPPLPPPLSSS